jgi:membrane-associated two-gene conflict system component 1 (EACC1)
MTDLHISANGEDVDDDSLWDWLCGEPELRGYLRRGEGDAPTGAMGSSTELIIAVTSSGAVTALARSLQVWFRQLRPDVNISIRGKGGQGVRVNAKHVQDLKDFTTTVFELTGNLPEDALGDR